MEQTVQSTAVKSPFMPASQPDEDLAYANGYENPSGKNSFLNISAI